MTSLARCSVVIPAHDEARVIGTCLTPLAPLAASSAVEVIVVANGCTDSTAAEASALAGVKVLEITTPSKVAALNAGDVAATTWPRIYLDADISLSPGALEALADALTTEEAVVGSVAVRFAVEGRPWPVRAFYRAYALTPYMTDQLVGLGVYAFSRTGRERFGAFPKLVADDLFVQRLFPAGERRLLRGHYATIQVPRTLSAIVAVRTRVARGNAQLAKRMPEIGGRSTPSTIGALLRLVRGGQLKAVDVAVYLAVNAVGRLHARISRVGYWQRDSTTR